MDGKLSMTNKLLKRNPERHHPASPFIVKILRVVPVKFPRTVFPFVFYQWLQGNVKTCAVLRRINDHRTLVSENEHGIFASFGARCITQDLNKNRVIGVNTIGSENHPDNFSFRKLSQLYTTEFYAVAIGGVGVSCKAGK